MRNYKIATKPVLDMLVRIINHQNIQEDSAYTLLLLIEIARAGMR